MKCNDKSPLRHIAAASSGYVPRKTSTLPSNTAAASESGKDTLAEFKVLHTVVAGGLENQNQGKKLDQQVSHKRDITWCADSFTALAVLHLRSRFLLTLTRSAQRGPISGHPCHPLTLTVQNQNVPSSLWRPNQPSPPPPPVT